MNLLGGKCFTGRLRPRITEIGVDFILFWTQYGVLLFPLNRPQKRKFARLYLGRFWLYRSETLHVSFGSHCLLAEKKLRQSERVTLASRNTLIVIIERKLKHKSGSKLVINITVTERFL